MDEVISMLQVDLGIDSRLAGCVQQVVDQRERVPVLFRDPVYSLVLEDDPDEILGDGGMIEAA